METAGTTPVTAVCELGSNAIVDGLFNSILNITKRILIARVRCVALKGSSGKAVCYDL